jgi:hypothetical protein
MGGLEERNFKDHFLFSFGWKFNSDSRKPYFRNNLLSGDSSSGMVCNWVFILILKVHISLSPQDAYRKSSFPDIKKEIYNDRIIHTSFRRYSTGCKKEY